MAKKLKINENFKSRRKRRFENVSKDRRIRLIVLSVFFKLPRTKFALRWKVIRDSVNCFKMFKNEKSASSCKFSNKRQT